MDERNRHKEGLKVRRAVLGEAHVERAQAARMNSIPSFQDFDHSLCLGRDMDASRPPAKNAQPDYHRHDGCPESRDELKMHIRGALQNGVTAKSSARSSADRSLLWRARRECCFPPRRRSPLRS